MIRWTQFLLAHNQQLMLEFERDVSLGLELFQQVPPKYDTYSISVILGNIVKTWVRSKMRTRLKGRLKQSTRNKEHKVYCSELAEIMYRTCGRMDILKDLGPQTHSAPVHLERQLLSGVFHVVADFGDLSRLIYAKK